MPFLHVIQTSITTSQITLAISALSTAQPAKLVPIGCQFTAKVVIQPLGLMQPHKHVMAFHHALLVHITTLQITLAKTAQLIALPAELVLSGLLFFVAVASRALGMMLLPKLATAFLFVISVHITISQITLAITVQ